MALLYGGYSSKGLLLLYARSVPISKLYLFILEGEDDRTGGSIDILVGA